MQDFLKEGSITLLRAQIFEATPLSVKTTPILDRFGEKLLALPINRSVFDRDFFAKVSHRSRFLSSLAREGSSI